MTQGLGRFKVVGRLGRGGMADVYVCKLQGIGGFEKEVVVKRIIPERANDPNFVKMFLDEARVSASLNHPHIVQVFEIAEDDGVPYMVMEYVRGMTLGRIIERLHRQKPGHGHLGHAAKIIAGICEALDYAHHALNAKGQPLGLVHRDVSPENIIVSGSGVAKLLDFGIAKAIGGLAQTDAGTIKGKVAYMAPEQVRNGTLDQRADIFSIGVCLYELTVGRNPFRGPGQNDVAVLRNIFEGTFPRPSEVDPDYPPELEEIVLLAMAPDVDQRCASARQLRDWLEGFCASGTYASYPRAVADWLRDLFPDFDRLTIEASPHAAPADAGPLAPSTSETRLLWARSGRLGRDSPTVDNIQNTPPGPPDAAAATLTPPPPSHLQNEPPTQPRLTPRRPVWGLALTFAAAAAVVGVYAWIARPTMPGSASVVSKVDDKTAAKVSEQGKPIVAPFENRPASSHDDAARAYLDTAEVLARERRFDLAREVLAKAAAVHIENGELRTRMARLSETVAAGTAATKRGLAGAKTAIVRLASKGKDPRQAESTSPRSMAVPEAMEPGARTIAGAPASIKNSEPPATSPAGAGGVTAVVAKAEIPPHAPPVPTSTTLAPAVAVATSNALSNASSSNASSSRHAEPAADGSVFSVMPKSPVPKPRLPRTVRAETSEDVLRAFQVVEAAAISTGGVSPEFGRGITAPLRRALGGRGELHPVGIYYFIIREASLRHDKRSVAEALVAAQSNGLLLKFNNLPAIEPAP